MNYGSKTWEQFTAEPGRLKERHGKDLFQFINEQDYEQIQRDSFVVGLRYGAKQIEYHLMAGRNNEDAHKKIEQEAQRIEGEK